MKIDPSSEFERRLLQQIAAHERAVAVLFNKFIDGIAPEMARFREPGKGALWAKNPGLKRSIDKHLFLLRKDLKKFMQSQTALAWGLSSDKMDQFINEYIGDSKINNIAREGLFSRNYDALKTFQQRKVAGMGLSARVWNNIEMTREQMDLFLSGEIASGRSAAEISRDVRTYLKNPDARFRRVRDPITGKLKLSQPMKNFHPGQGKYRSAYKNALRMTRTETNMAYRMADIERYRKTDFILGYEVKLSGMHPEFDICDHMVGRYPKTFTFGGWHPNCYCYMVPVLPSQNEFVKYLEDGNMISGSKVKGIPPRAAKYIKDKTPNFNNWQNPPYWLKDNFTLKNGKYVPGSGIAKPPPVQGAIFETREQFKPVSDSIEYISPSIKKHVDSALKAINSVHDDGVLPKIPIKLNNRMEAEGVYKSYRVFGSNKMIAKDINIKTLRARSPEFSTIHELGHFIDQQGIGGMGVFESEKGASGIMNGIMKSIEASKAFKRLEEISKMDSIILRGREFKRWQFESGMEYMLRKRELWARAYTQYIAEKSGNSLLLNQLQLAQIGDVIPGQWDAEDFKAIMKEIDKLFKELGWLK